jgi:hypothetical protein
MDDGFLELGVQGRLEKATDRPLHWASGPGAGPGGPRGSTVLLLAFESRNFKGLRPLSG